MVAVGKVEQMTLLPEKVVAHYVEAYQKLYKRNPKELQILDHEWVIVNGARMRLAELAYLTAQLQLEYNQESEARRTVLQRLVTWLKR